MRELEVGDEVFWYDDKDERRRGRVCDSDGELVVRPYDVLGRLQLEEHVALSPTRMRLASGVDQLAELAPIVMHLSHLIECYEGGRGHPKATYCGDWKINTEHKPWSLHSPKAEVDPLRVHQRGFCSDDPWKKLIEDTALALDYSDRSEPLKDRELPDEAYESAAELKLCPRCFRAAVMERTWPLEPGRLSEEELKRFVLGFLDGSVYSDRHIPSWEAVAAAETEEEAQRAAERWGRDCSMVFMYLMLSPPPPKDYAEKIALVWEWFEKRGPRSINGMPGFFSHHFMHRDDWKRAAPAIERELKRRREFEI